MKITRFAAADFVEPHKGWKRTSLCGETDISIEHFVKPPRHASPEHQHENQQILVVLQGSLVVRKADGSEETLETGDCAYLPSNEPHSVINQSDEPATGLDIFVPGRSIDFWSQQTAD